MRLFLIVFAVLVSLGIWHEISIFGTRNNPPVSCQLLGGQWNMFTGWQCGVSTSQTTNTLPVSNDSNPCDGPNASQIGDCIPNGGINGAFAATPVSS